MRVLAMTASAFSAAVFLACYLLPGGWLLPVGLVLILSGAALALVLRKRPRPRLAALLVCWGAAAGLVWTAAYTQIFFQPARELDGRTVMLSGTVAEYPQEEDYGWSVLVRAETEGWVTVNTVLYVDEQGTGLRPGDNISSVVHCTLADRTFSGEEITYYTAKGVFLRGEAYGRLEIQRPERVPLRDWPALLARAVRDGIDAAFPPEAAPLVRALVTGNRDTLTDQFTTSLERTGLSHTVAVSGMHLAFLASMISLLMGRGKRSTALATAVCVLVFCGVAGSTPSVVRSAVMILLLQAAPLLGRERDGPTALSFALMLLLIWNPFSAAHIGLQLSFGAVAGILLLSDFIQDWLSGKLGLDRPARGLSQKLLRPVLRFGVSTLSATLGASVLTVPLVAIHFQNVSLISPLSNLLTLWAVSWLFSGGMLAGLLAIFLPGPAQSAGRAPVPAGPVSGVGHPVAGGAALLRPAAGLLLLPGLGGVLIPADRGGRPPPGTAAGDPPVCRDGDPHVVPDLHRPDLSGGKADSSCTGCGPGPERAAGQRRLPGSGGLRRRQLQ